MTKTSKLSVLTRLTRRDFGRSGLAAATMAALPGIARAETITSHGLSAFGDLKYPTDFAHFEYADPNAPKGGTWSTGYGGVTYDSFNGFILKGTAEPFTPSIIYDSLMTASVDEADSYYPLIAESVELPADRSWVAFNINPAARFHDGTPITSADVEWTFNTLITRGAPQYRVLLQPVTGVATDGPQKVRFDFDPKASKRDLPMLVASLRILSKAYYEANNFDEATLDPPLGSSAYKIGDFEAGQHVTFERVKDYWAADLPVNRGRHNFDKLKFVYFLDRSAAFEGFKGGAYLFNEEFTSKQWASAYTPEQFPAIARGEVVIESIPDDTPSGSQGFWFNLRREKFQDLAVRKALGLAFDFEWSNQRLFYNLYERTDSFFEGGPMQAEGPPTPGELAILERFADKLPPGVMTEPAYVPPKTDGSGRVRRELRQAGKILDEAGWKIVDGKRLKDGKTLDVEFLMVANSGFARIVQPFIKNLERLGVKGTTREVDPSQYRKRLDEFEFDITTSRKVMSLTPGVELRDYFGSAGAAARGSRNTAGIADPTVDAMIDLIERADSRETLTSAVKALDRVLRAMHIWVPQWSKASHHLAYWDIFDRPKIKPAYDRGVIDLWWVDTEKEAKLKAAGRI